VVALVVSILIATAMTVGVVRYAARRPQGTPTTWGEAMFGAVYVFGIFFLAFGTIPHQWLTLAENEWSWRADRIFNAWGLLTAKSRGGWFPFEITYRVLSDSIAASFYIVFLGVMSKLWGNWQTRGDGSKSGSEVVTSTYGRPLVKRS
jgi:hypothetical protein